jgi:alpha-ketoglutarate-dependent taurine dioxygenase
MTITTPFATFYLNIAEEHAEKQIERALLWNGIITFDAIRSTKELLHLCRRLGAIVKHRDADETGLTRIVKRSPEQSISSYQAFTDSHLTLHTDGTSILDPAPLIVLWCAQPAEEGGASLFVDGKHIYQLLLKAHPQLLEALAMPASAIFAGSTTPIYSSVFQTFADGTISIRFRYDSLGYYSTPVCAALPVFLDLLNQYKISFLLQKHQGYIIHNRRWLHGRTAFRGEREVYRVLVRPAPETYVGAHVGRGFRPDP